ncbi:hypothetical protein J2778_003698 [Paraburkholderia graminis]|uniref:hypothetical protein n=1 Tax=Paraburkholderia graminis TaxID=60548 RepID=UPI0028559F55|nr:hypothetical protein [Paraburkholderia graminis]MDR6476198.1 hypothetical protein [Paraburkholderia graminis]
MAAYPSVNWWSGNIRRFESRVSFALRFRELNCISGRKCLDFLSINPVDDTPVGSGDIKRLSAILGEPLSDVESLFARSMGFDDCGRYAPPRRGRGRQFVRYCDVCANCGYHSYLHELEWLAKCPFHGCELKEAWIGKHAGSIALQHMDALNAVMHNQCGSWPHYDNDFPAANQEHIVALENWVVRARRAATRASDAEIWCSAPHAILGNISLAQAFGQLRALACMPEVIEPFVIETGGTWRVQRRQFPNEAKLEIERLDILGVSFSRVLEAYQSIAYVSAGPPPFVTRLEQAKNALQERHGRCHCEWGLFRGGWESHWVKVYPDEQQYRSLSCPFEVALEELERGWGGPGEALIGRKAVQEQLRFIFLAHEMHTAGLIRYKSDADVSSDGYLYVGQDLTSCCIWEEKSPLTKLLDTASTWEIDSACSALSMWLDDIEEGVRPAQRDDPKYCVRLGKAGTGLSLIRWIPAFGAGRPRRPPDPSDVSQVQ